MQWKQSNYKDRCKKDTDQGNQYFYTIIYLKKALQWVNVNVLLMLCLIRKQTRSK